MLEQNKRDLEHQTLSEQLQSLHVEQGRARWGHQMVKTEIGKSAQLLESRRKWLYRRLGSASGKMGRWESFADSSMFDSPNEIPTTTNAPDFAPNVHIWPNTTNGNDTAPTTHIWPTTTNVADPAPTTHMRPTINQESPPVYYSAPVLVPPACPTIVPPENATS